MFCSDSCTNISIEISSKVSIAKLAVGYIHYNGAERAW